MEVEMKSIAKIICCGVALTWMCGASARGEDADTNQAAEVEVTEVAPAADAVEVSALPTGGSSSLLTQTAAGSSQAAASTQAAAGSTQIATGSTAPASAGATSNATPPADALVAPAAPVTEDVKVVPTPPAPRVAVKPYRDKINRTKVEKRIENNAAITRKRTATAEKDVAERAAKQQQGQ
jgi:hypothetical protein